MNDMIHPLTDDHFENEKVIEKIKRLKEVAVVSAASLSGMPYTWHELEIWKNHVFLDLSKMKLLTL